MLGVTTSALARNSFAPWGRNGLESVKEFERDARAHASVVMWYSDWANVRRPDLGQLRAVARRGSLPEITWEPWDHAKGLWVPQPAFRLRRIIAGRYDALIRRWARDLAAYGGPVRLRFAQEMNGNWYPWAETFNGNRGEFAKAWRRVWRIFRREGAANVEWVWSRSCRESRGSNSRARLCRSARGLGVRWRRDLEIPTLAVLRDSFRRRTPSAQGAWRASRSS